MQTGDTTVPARDGHPLAATLCEPERPNGISILISSATTVPRGYYTKFAGFLCAQGFAVLTYDFRGIGGSVNKSWRGRPASFRAWGEEDLAGAIEWLAGRFPDNELMCVGHSMGGSVLGLAANNQRVTAQVAIASQSAYWRNWDRDNARNRFWIWSLGHILFPLVTPIFGEYPGWTMGSNPWPKGVALEWARWSRDPNFVIDEHGAPLRQYYHQYRGRMRFYSFSDDLDYAPPRAVAHMASFYRNADVEVLYREPQHYGVKGVGHFGFFRSFMPASAWQEVADWLRDSSARPAANVEGHASADQLAGRPAGEPVTRTP